jgi:hypothetical protein
MERLQKAWCLADHESIYELYSQTLTSVGGSKAVNVFNNFVLIMSYNNFSLSNNSVRLCQSLGIVF